MEVSYGVCRSQLSSETQAAQSSFSEGFTQAPAPWIQRSPVLRSSSLREDRKKRGCDAPQFKARRGFVLMVHSDGTHTQIKIKQG